MMIKTKKEITKDMNSIIINKKFNICEEKGQK